jgi:hypothetical protein
MTLKDFVRRLRPFIQNIRVPAKDASLLENRAFWRRLVYRDWVLNPYNRSTLEWFGLPWYALCNENTVRCYARTQLALLNKRIVEEANTIFSKDWVNERVALRLKRTAGENFSHAKVVVLIQMYVECEQQKYSAALKAQRLLEGKTRKANREAAQKGQKVYAQASEWSRFSGRSQRREANFSEVLISALIAIPHDQIEPGKLYYVRYEMSNRLFLRIGAAKVNGEARFFSDGTLFGTTVDVPSIAVVIPVPASDVVSMLASSEATGMWLPVHDRCFQVGRKYRCIIRQASEFGWVGICSHLGARLPRGKLRLATFAAAYSGEPGLKTLECMTMEQLWQEWVPANVIKEWRRR